MNYKSKTLHHRNFLVFLTFDYLCLVSSRLGGSKDDIYFAIIVLDEFSCNLHTLLNIKIRYSRQC
jgi:hypothetical protein